MKKLLSLSVFVLLFSTAIFADVRVDTPSPTPKPKANKSIDTELTIKLQRDAKEARLIIPKNQLKQLRAQIDDLDDSSDTMASASFTKTQTIISGLFLSLAFVFGGVWFVRSRKIDTKASKTLVIGSVLFLSGAVATIAFANAGPPAEARSITSKMFSKAFDYYKFGYGKIKLEVSSEARNPELIVPDVPEEKKPNGDE